MGNETKSTRNRPRLGRGLSSLIGKRNVEEESTPTPAESTDYAPVSAEKAVREAPSDVPTPATPAPEADGKPREVPLDRIVPNPHQPRREFAEAELAELADSIREQGILQPLIVAHRDGDNGDSTYTLIAGERRLRAARLAELTAVPCIVREATDQQMLEWALIENIQRTDLNPIERAQAYRGYVDRFGLTQAEAAKKLGKPRTTIANHLRLLDLSEDIQGWICSGQLSFGHAKILAGLSDQPELQAQFAAAAAAGLSVRDLEALVAEAMGPGDDDGEKQAPASKADRKTKPPYVIDLEEQLTRAVGTRVTIRPGRSERTGKIVIEYYSLDDFDRISESLGLRVES